MTTSENTVTRLKAESRLRERGNRYEDFRVGERFVHHWGRTLTESNNVLLCTLTLHYKPHYTNVAYAQAHGHPASPVNPLLVFNTAFGLSVEDLSEIGVPFLGVEELSYLRDVYPGETLYAASEVIAARLASNRPGQGIVTWHTRGWSQRDEQVITRKRANLVWVRS